MIDAWSQRYLDFLEVPFPTPNLETLDAIARAHERVVFENVTSLLRRQETPEGAVPPIDFETVLSNWQIRRGGGVCYEIGGMLNRLLPSLGYQAQPTLAQIMFPGSHQAVIVTLPSGRYLVDCGNGSPVHGAIALEGGPVEIHRAGLSYRFGVEADAVVQDRMINQEWTPFCSYDLQPATESARIDAYQRHHALPAQSFVTKNLRLVRCNGDVVLQLFDHQLTTYTPDGKTTEEVYGLQHYRELISDAFAMPNLPIEQGLEAWTSLTGNSV